MRNVCFGVAVAIAMEHEFSLHGIMSIEDLQLQPWSHIVAIDLQAHSSFLRWIQMDSRLCLEVVEAESQVRVLCQGRESVIVKDAITSEVSDSGFALSL